MHSYFCGHGLDKGGEILNCTCTLYTRSFHEGFYGHRSIHKGQLKPIDNLSLFSMHKVDKAAGSHFIKTMRPQKIQPMYCCKFPTKFSDNKQNDTKLKVPNVQSVRVKTQDDVKAFHVQLAIYQVISHMNIFYEHFPCYPTHLNMRTFTQQPIWDHLFWKGLRAPPSHHTVAFHSVHTPTLNNFSTCSTNNIQVSCMPVKEHFWKKNFPQQQSSHQSYLITQGEFCIQHIPCSVSFRCMLELDMGSERRTFYIGALMAKLILACQEVLKGVWPSMNQNMLLFAQTPTSTSRMHQKIY